MLIMSIVVGILCSASTIILGRKFGSFGMTLGYLVLTVVSFLWTYLIFKSKKNDWHSE